MLYHLQILCTVRVLFLQTQQALFFIWDIPVCISVRESVFIQRRLKLFCRLEAKAETSRLQNNFNVCCMWRTFSKYTFVKRSKAWFVLCKK
jgi:hypothetical protein